MSRTLVGQKIRERRLQLRLSQEAVAKRAGVTQSTVDRIEKGDFKRMPESLRRIAQALGMRLGDLDPAFEDMDARTAQVFGPNPGDDFKIYGAAAAGEEGQIIISSDPIDYVPWPPIVWHARDAYGLYVSGESMIPEFEPGDIAIVNPRLPLLPNVTAILYSQQNGDTRAMIKRIVRFTGATWHLRQWNPPQGHPAEFTLPRKDWPTAHRVAGKYARR